MNFSKLILGIYGALFVVVAVWAGGFFIQMHRDYTVIKTQETVNQRKLADAQTRLQSQEKYLDQLRHDPVLIERIIRERLHYAKEEEFVFRFEEQK